MFNSFLLSDLVPKDNFCRKLMEELDLALLYGYPGFKQPLY